MDGGVAKAAERPLLCAPAYKNDVWEDAMDTQKPVVIVTGAYGGMGRACARRLGHTARLVLSDIDQGRLDAFAAALSEEGFDVAAVVAGDLSLPGVAARLVAAARQAGPLRTLVHTAGLSPMLAPWDAILNANVVAVELLLRELEQDLPRGFVAVLIASLAAHVAQVDGEMDAILADPLADGFLQRAQARLEVLASLNGASGLGMPAYAQSKRAILRLCERRAVPWGPRGARMVTISPGVIATPMGRAEVENNPAASKVVEGTPIGRWGTALDISAAVEFVVSDAAGFITGSDLKVDGGAIGARNQP